jgi:tetratricopeptide (TPR) repeat protein
MNLDKLKDAARRHELREEWRKAIEIYHRALDELARAHEPADPSLYNRIGDLELKDGDPNAALTAYEQAADTYGEQGFFNNAIALCGKILRVSPNRTSTFLRLADLHARKNVVAESRRNLQDFVERMLSGSHYDQLSSSLKAYAERYGASAEFRGMLVDLLRACGRNEQGREFCRKLIQQLGLGEGQTLARSPGRSEHQPPRIDLVFIDTGIDIPGLPTSGLITGEFSIITDPVPDGVETETIENAPAPVVEPLPFVEPTQRADEAGPSEVESPPLSGFEPTRVSTGDEGEIPYTDFDGPLIIEERADPFPVSGLERQEEFTAPIEGDLGFEPVSLEENGLITLDPETLIRSAAEHLGADTPAEPVNLFPEDEDELAAETVEPEATAAAVIEATPAEPEPAPEPEPEPEDDDGLFDELSVDVDPLRLGGSVEELDHALNEARHDERWEDAVRILKRLLQLEPTAVPRHQQRVEIAYRSGNRQHLIDAYLSLAQALAAIGATENSALVFQRVLEHDPRNPVAAAGLAALGTTKPPAREPLPGSIQQPLSERPEEPAPAAAAPSPSGNGQFVDLGALILDPEPEKDTRIRVDQGEPQSEEDVDFRETLEQFKQGVEANLEAGDFQAHYDLGIAFREMGLLDEAIAQFQKALRSAEGRLKASEALGMTFFEMSRFGIAEAVLGRAVEALPGADDEKIALIYWLGRSLEAQQKIPQALRCYERTMAVDITFLDVGDRIHRLTAEQMK